MEHQDFEHNDMVDHQTPQQSLDNMVEYLKEDILSPQQESFCRFYTQNPETYGNGTLSYAEAYGFDLDNADKDDGVYEYLDGTVITTKDNNIFDLGEDRYKELNKWEKRLIKKSTHSQMYDVCSAAASRLLRTVKVQGKIREYYLEMMTDETIDSVLSSIILNKNEHGSTRISGIKEYNALKARIIKKLDLSTMGEKINTTDPSLIALAEEYEQRLKDTLTPER